MISCVRYIFIGLLFACTLSPARGSDVPADWPAAVAAFDDAVKSLEAAEPAARDKLAAVADRFRAFLDLPLSDHARAQVLYNLGATEQLRNAPAQALLHLTQADLLFPALPGLDERLHAAKQSLLEDASSREQYKPAPGLKVVTNLAYSMPRTWLLWTALVAWAALWLAFGLILSRRLVPTATALAITCAAIWLIAAGWFTAIELRLRDARHLAIISSEAIPRDQPDTLIGSTVGSPLKPGDQVIIHSHSTGSDGASWARVGRQNDAETFWLPAASVSPVLPPDTLFQFEFPRTILTRGPTSKTP